MSELTTPEISVIIPVYNAQDWIGASVQSVLDQTYPREALEVIVVDDGSTDQSCVVAESLLKPAGTRYAIIKTKQEGPSRARNIGWRRARGPWIQFLDADDLLHPRKIEIQAEAARSLPPEVAVVYSDWQRLALRDQEWQPVGAIVSPNIESDPVADLLQTENFIQIGSPLIRRSWLERVSGFDERYWLIEDVHLLLRIAMAGGKFYHVESDTPLFFYRQREAGSLSRRDQHEFVEGCVRNAQMVEEHWLNTTGLNPERRELLLQVYSQAARFFFEYDRLRFNDIYAKLLSLDRTYSPSGPSMLRLLSRWIGYPRAEAVALAYRKLKRSMSA